jgi:hypothetical protein
MAHLPSNAPAPGGLPRRWYAPFAIALFGVLLALSAVIVPNHASAAPAAATRLVGALQLTPGSCAGGKATGTYFRMILPSGGTNGPYMSNSDSRCSDQSFTPLSPGSDGGLRVGSYQPSSTPRFDSSGDARARRITAPAPFYGTSFATSTTSVDPQTKKAVPAPSLSLSGNSLSADLRSFAVTWNNQDFNQGAPKPDGSTPGNTRRATGTYNAATGAFTLNWASQVVGGPFDKFTGSWHFEGRFVPAAGSAPSTGGGPAAGGTPSTPGTSGGTGTAATPGAPAAPVTPGAPSAPAAGGVVPPGAAPIVTTGAPASPVTKIVTTEKWRVSWPVIGLAAGIALLAIGGLVVTSILTKRPDSTP